MGGLFLDNKIRGFLLRGRKKWWAGDLRLFFLFPARRRRRLRARNPGFLRHFRGPGLPALQSTAPAQLDGNGVFLRRKYLRDSARGLIDDALAEHVYVSRFARAVTHTLYYARQSRGRPVRIGRWFFVLVSAGGSRIMIVIGKLSDASFNRRSRIHRVWADDG